MQLVFYWAPKLARKCKSKHWFPCGADGRSYGHVITKFSRMGRLPHFLSYGAPSTRALRARVELRYEGMVILADTLHIVVVICGVVFFYILLLGPSVFALSILLPATFCKYHG